MKVASRFDDAKDATDLVALFGSYGVELSKNGKGYSGVCPFHDDQTPSLSVSPEKRVWHCFGCDQSGSAIDLVMLQEGISAEEACSRLLGRINGTERRNHGKFEPKKPQVEARTDLLDKAASHYAESLQGALTARNYLAQRGILDPELLSRFEIGYGDGSLKGAIDKAEGKAAGLLTKRGTDFFYRQITFPLRDADGRVLSFYGRHTQRARHAYLAGPQQGLFCDRGLFRESTVILTESIIDALSAMRLGVENVLPLNGVNGLTRDHKAFLRRKEVREVTLLLDNDDDAGSGAVESLTKLLKPLRASIYRARLPRGIKDLNDFLVKGRAESELQELLERRELLFEGSGPKPKTAVDKTEARDPGPTEPTCGIRAATLVPVGEQRVEKHNGGGSADEQETEATETAEVGEGLVSFEDGRAVFEFDGLRYDVRGIRIRSETTMRVLVLLTAEAGIFRDRPDLYLHRSRRAFAQEAADRLGLPASRIEAHLNRLVAGIETVQEEELKKIESGCRQEKQELTEEEHVEAMALLMSSDILGAVARDLEQLGYVGEAEAKKVAYLIATSRRSDRPLSGIIRSSSGAGKSRLMEMVTELMPPEEVEYFSRITPQSLYYMGKNELSHKL
ncbi:CHC2 zinc finger domain-containing protein [Planctomycetota bacterium]